jgi:hypothetical protein
MEKYRKFADGPTGVQPFLSPRGSQSVLSMFLILPLYVIRLPLAVIVWSWWHVMRLFIFALYLPILQRPLERYVDRIGLRLFMLIQGVAWMQLPPASPTVPFLLLSNLSTPWDVCLLQIAYSPLFIVPSTQKSGKVQIVGLSTAMHCCISPQVSEAEGKWLTVLEATQIAATKRKPCVLLLEGTGTNGKGVLAPLFPPSSTIPPPLKGRWALCSWRWSSILPYHTVAPLYQQLFFSYPLSILYVSATGRWASGGSTERDLLLRSAQGTLAKLAGLVALTTVDAATKVEFEAFYTAAQQQNYLKRSEDPKSK